MILQGEPAKAAGGKGGKGKDKVKKGNGKSVTEGGAVPKGRKSKAAKEAALVARVGEKSAADESGEAGGSVRKSRRVDGEPAQADAGEGGEKDDSDFEEEEVSGKEW